MAALDVDEAVETPVGQLKLVWGDAGLLRSCSFLVDSADHAPARAATKAPIDLVRQRRRLFEQALKAYFLDGEFRWELAWLDWSSTTPFQQRVLRACYQIPGGQTVSYRELANQVGSPQGARAVGRAMARNRWPLLIPCHRVLGTAGQLTGYSGTGGTATKRWLLEFERGLTLSGATRNIWEIVSPPQGQPPFQTRATTRQFEFFFAE